MVEVKLEISGSRTITRSNVKYITYVIKQKTEIERLETNIVNTEWVVLQTDMNDSVCV